MKKLIFLLLLFFFVNNLFASCICYYKNHPCCKKTCEYYSRVVDESCEIKSLNNFNKDGVYDKLLLVGFGNYYGLYKDNINCYALDNTSVISWKNVAKIKANLLLIDACYAGFIYRYKSSIPVIITSTGEENSWNVIDLYGNNISSLSSALNCIYNVEYNCPIDCIGLSVNQCQFNLIIWSWKYQFNLDGFKMYDWEYPSMGTCKINGGMCR